MDTKEIIKLEAELRFTSFQLTLPRVGECSLCYTLRMLQEFGCNNHLRWVDNYVATAAPRVAKFQERLARRGGFCDCEVFLNAYEPADWATDEEGNFLDWLRCLGARRGSTKPCRLWQPRRRR